MSRNTNLGAQVALMKNLEDMVNLGRPALPKHLRRGVPTVGYSKRRIAKMKRRINGTVILPPKPPTLKKKRNA